MNNYTVACSCMVFVCVIMCSVIGQLRRNAKRREFFFAGFVLRFLMGFADAAADSWDLRLAEAAADADADVVELDELEVSSSSGSTRLINSLGHFSSNEWRYTCVEARPACPSDFETEIRLGLDFPSPASEIVA